MSLARANTVGLPSNPRTRSSTPGLPRQNIPSRPPSSASERPPPSSYYSSAAPPLPLQPRTIRTQRSIGSISTRPAGSLRSHSLDRSSESRHALRSESPPPLPSLPRGPRIVAAQPRGRTPAPVRVHTSSIDRPEDYGGSRRRQDVLSDSGSSSAGSDGFDGPPESASSSRTSMNEMEVDDKADKKPPAGFGSSLWGSITGVASNLTVSVSKAWSSNVASYSGEETPVGGESRLTRAMKAYHTEKAHDPRDLPDWLFDERERGVRSTRTTSSSASEKKPAQETRPAELPRSVATDMDDDASPPPRITRGPTLADRKASSVSSSASNISVARAGSKEHVTKSMARLRELRDAKRGAKVRFDDAEAEAEEIREPPLRSDPVARPAPPSEPQLQPRLFRDRERMPPPTRPRGNMPAPLGASLGVRGRQPVGLPSGVRPVRS